MHHIEYDSDEDYQNLNLNPDNQPLCSDVLEQLPKSEFKLADLPQNATDAEKSCVVCMSEYEESEQQLTLTCFHKFHASCIS